MPTPEEKITQIETALRTRYFQYVPKIEKENRNTWTEENHNTDRLTRSLAAYAVASLSEIDDATASGKITDGDDDCGIDAIHYDRPNACLIIVQSKFKKNGAAPSQAENLKTINGIKDLILRRFDKFNQHFQNRLDEIEDALNTPGIRIELGLVYLGENIGPHVTKDLNDLKDELAKNGLELNWTGFGLSDVHEWLVQEETPLIVDVTITLENWGIVNNPRKAIYGQISARNLAQLVATHGKALFERNIRQYLGSVGVNSAIERTALTQPTEFFYLNNGITAIAESIVPSAGSRETCNFRLNKISIVNGAQTAGTISSIENVSEDAKILITIIETGDNHDDISIRVTKSRNYQTAVRGVDFAALDPNQERLRRELAVSNIIYHYRPSAEARIRNENSFTLEDASVALASQSMPILSSDQVALLVAQRRHFNNGIDYIVAIKKEIGRLWEQGESLYSELFNRDLSGIRMCRLVKTYRFLEIILSSTERSETTYYRRMFFKHGKYFIIAFVASRSIDILNKPDDRLSEDDKHQLSQKVNELSELIYAESIDFQGTKGYLSIFRNLTDSQQLADKVLAKLAEQDNPPQQQVA